MTKLSLAICTYNRSKYLDLCLKSLVIQTSKKELFEVLIIDNNSTDETQKICLGYVSQNMNFKYFKEENVGLSFARNRALKESICNWISYLDDDAIAPTDFVERTLFNINEFQFVAFGGPIIPEYHENRPEWILKETQRAKDPIDKIGVLYDNYLKGGNITLNKEELVKIGGFPTDLGMSGTNTAYGEEDYIQKRFRQKGLDIGYDPNLGVKHFVLPNKYKLVWHLFALFAHGRDKQKVEKNDNFLLLIYYLLRTLFVAMLIKIPSSFYKMIVKKDYYYQNFILDSLRFFITSIGRFIGYIQLANSDKTR